MANALVFVFAGLGGNALVVQSIPFHDFLPRTHLLDIREPPDRLSGGGIDNHDRVETVRVRGEWKHDHPGRLFNLCVDDVRDPVSLEAAEKDVQHHTKFIAGLERLPIFCDQAPGNKDLLGVASTRQRLDRQRGTFRKGLKLFALVKLRPVFDFHAGLLCLVAIPGIDVAHPVGAETNLDRVSPIVSAIHASGIIDIEMWPAGEPAKAEIEPLPVVGPVDIHCIAAREQRRLGCNSCRALFIPFARFHFAVEGDFACRDGDHLHRARPLIAIIHHRRVRRRDRPCRHQFDFRSGGGVVGRRDLVCRAEPIHKPPAHAAAPPVAIGFDPLR